MLEEGRRYTFRTVFGDEVSGTVKKESAGRVVLVDVDILDFTGVPSYYSKVILEAVDVDTVKDYKTGEVIY